MMQDRYTIDEFIEQAIQRGYASRNQKKQIREWCEKQDKEHFTNDDLVEIYRRFNTPMIGADIPFGRWRYTWDGHKTTKHYDDGLVNY